MTDRSAPGEALYRALLRLYPGPFREQHAEDLVEIFRYRREQRVAERGWAGPGFWIYIAGDLATSAWLEWRRPVPGLDRETRTRRGGEGMRGWYDDVAYAVRRLARSPGFSLTALVILVLGIGVNTTAFSLVNSLLFQPPPFEAPERVVLVLQDSDGGTPNSTSYPAYLDIARYDEVFEYASAYYTDQAFMERDGDLVPVQAEYATSSYLDVLGLTPSRGRWFDAVQDDPSGPPAAVLSHKMWSDRLGSDPDVLGSTVRIGGRTITVIGVGPEAFNGGAGPATIDLWLSISSIGPTGGRLASLTRRQDHPFRVRARLAAGVTIGEAGAAMDRLADELAVTYPALNATRGISVLSVLTNRVTPEVDARMVPIAALAMAVVVLVLLIGTLNLANLLLVRTTVRARELAVRLALGAGRGRLVRVVLSEAIVLSVVGGVGGLLFAAGIAQAIGNVQFDLGLPTSLDVRLDTRVLFFASTVSVVTGLVFGLLPALRATSKEVAASLHHEATATIGARRRFGLTGSLVAAQVAISLLLLAVAGVFIESLGRARGADPGFAWESTGYVRVSLQPLDLDRTAAPLLFDRLEERLTSLPDVNAISMAIQLPAAMFGTTTLLLGSGTGGVDAPTEIPWNSVGHNFFEVLGIPVLAGRSFEEADATGPDVAIVSEAMALTHWGRLDVVGESYRSESSPDDPVEIVGVVGDVPVRALGEVPQPALYWVQESMPFGSFIFEARSTPAEAIPAIRAAVAEVDDRILVLESAAMSDHLGSTLQRQRLAGSLLGGLGTLALILAVLGVYGVVSFAVSRRRHEVGIRIALGAGRDSVVRLFVRDVATVVVVGGVIGMALSVPASRIVGQLFTGAPGTPLATTVAAVLLIGTALVATVIPAMRAARTDPTQALRRE